MFYLNTIEQLFLLVEQVDQLEVCLPNSRLLAGIPKLAVFQNLRWNSNKTSLTFLNFNFTNRLNGKMAFLVLGLDICKTLTVGIFILAFMRHDWKCCDNYIDLCLTCLRVEKNCYISR